MKKQEKRNNQKGVTLVALVVTIIILIILAGVSINLLLGENGIITQAQKAKEDTEQAKIEEEKALNSVYGYLNIDPNNYVRPEEMESLREEFNQFKVSIAQAVTNKGIETSSTDTVEKMVENIGKISGFSISKVSRSWSAWSADLGNNFRYDTNLTDQADYRDLVLNENLFLGPVGARQRQVNQGAGVPSISYNPTNGSLSLTTGGNWEITSCTLYIIRK